MADYGEEAKTPSIPDPAHADLATAVRAMKEWIEVRQGARGNGLDRAVTMRDLLNAGLATPQALANLTTPPDIVQPPPGAAEPAVPPTPQNLGAAGAVTTIVLTWDFARGYSRLAYFEVWRSATDAIGDAAKIAQAYGPIYADEVGAAAGFYYWVRAVSDAGTSPFNAVGGTLGETAPSAAEVNAAIQDSIDATGLLEQLTVKTSVDGYISGYGLASTPSLDDGSATTFAVLASRFLVTGPASGGILPASPFMVQTVPMVLNGVEVPRGVYMTDAFFMNGIITNAKIGQLAVDDAKIASVSVAKLTAGKLAVGEYIESTGFQGGQSGFHIDGDGNAEFNGVVARGTIYANAGSIGGNIISADGVRSAAYSPNTAGWKISPDGSVEFNAGTFRGALVAATGSFKGSLDAATGSFKGALDAATGTFAGQVKGGSFVTGNYIGYAWPAAGGKGTYLGPGGLLLGNANDGKYFQVTDTGDLYAPGLSIVAGQMHINAVDVVDTLNVRGNAVSATLAFAGTTGAFLLYTPVPSSLVVLCTADVVFLGTGSWPSGGPAPGSVSVSAVGSMQVFGFITQTGSSGGDTDVAYYSKIPVAAMQTFAIPAGYTTVSFSGGGLGVLRGVAFLMKR